MFATIIESLKGLDIRIRRLRRKVVPAPEWHRNWDDPVWLERYLGPERYRLYREVTSRVPPRSYSWVVEVGCGAACLLREFVEKRSEEQGSCKFMGLDISDAAVRVARRTCGEAIILRGSVYNMPFREGSLDLVLCVEVLEHLSRPRHALEEMMRVVRKDGNVLITVPDGARDNWAGHNNFWDEKSFQRFLSPYPVVSLERIPELGCLFGMLSKKGGECSS